MTDAAEADQGDWRTATARVAVDCIGMGLRTVHVGLEENPFALRTMRAGQRFDGPLADDDGVVAPTAGLYVLRPFETGWDRLCGTMDDDMEDAIAALLEAFGERTGEGVLELMVLRRAERLADVKRRPAEARNGTPTG